MRVLEWISADRVDAEAIADVPVIEAIAAAGHEEIRILPLESEADPARPIRETAGIRRLPWDPRQAFWYEAGEVDAIVRAHRGKGIDLVWARGRTAWRAAARAARRLQAPLWIELGSLDEAASLRRVPRGVDLLLTVATDAEADRLQRGLAGRLLQDADGRHLKVPPAIGASSPRPAGPDSEDLHRIVIVDPGRPPTRSGLRFAETLLEEILQRPPRSEPPPSEPSPSTPSDEPSSVPLPSGSTDGASSDASGSGAFGGDPRFEIFIEEPLGDRASIRRLLARLADRERSTSPSRPPVVPHAGVVRIPPLGRCRGVLGDGDLLVAPRPLHRLRPAVVEALGASTLLASPPDPELDDWLGDGEAGILVTPRSDSATRRREAIELLDILRRPDRRRAITQTARDRLAPLLDPTTRVRGVLEAIERVAEPHTISKKPREQASDGAWPAPV